MSHISQDDRAFMRTRNLGLSLACQAVSKSKTLSRYLRLIIDHAEFNAWVSTRFPDSQFRWTRETLWAACAQEMQKIRLGYQVLEFGVFHGYTTAWWLENATTTFDTWHGFDTFTGLSEPWRDLPRKTFDASGIPPTFADSRVSFVVGDVQNTVVSVQLDSRPKLLIFDLDLIKPTRACWDYLEPFLNSHDLLIFDEAFDSGERSIIEDEVIQTFKVTGIAHTHTALALKILRRK